MTTVTVIGRAGCHLCPTALGIVETVVAELPDRIGDRIVVVEQSIEDDPDLYELWWEKIPVVLIDGKLHAHWRVDPARLRAALESAQKDQEETK